MLRPLLRIFTIAAFVVKFQDAAIFQCPNPGVDVIPCYQDCQNQHGAPSPNGGTCDSNDNCKCTYPPYRQTAEPNSAQCRDPSLSLAYDFVCDTDCKCFHGALGGTCNYTTNACICGEDATGQCPILLPYLLNLVIKDLGLINVIG